MNYQTCTKCLSCKPEHQFYFEKRLNRPQARCKQCVREYLHSRKAYSSERNKERYQERKDKGFKAKPYDSKSPEARKMAYDAVKRWRDRNKDKALHEAKLAIRLKRSKAYIELWPKVLEHYGNRCLCCNSTDMSKLCFDHVKPLSQGGANNITNGQPLCRKCNTFKGHNGSGDNDYRPDKGEYIKQLVYSSGIEVDNRESMEGNGMGIEEARFPVVSKELKLTPAQLQQQRHLADIIAHCPP